MESEIASPDPAPRRRPRLTPLMTPLMGLLLSLAGVAALGAFLALAAAGLAGRRGETEGDGERDHPIRAPLRVSAGRGGEPVITLSEEERRLGGLETAKPASAPRESLVRAYGAVLDLANFNALNNNYTAAVSQLQIAQARLSATAPAFERARSLYKDGAGSLVQLQAAEAAQRSDAASVAVAQAQVRALAATAVQEWGQTLGKALTGKGPAGEEEPLVSRLIEREAFLVQLTLPPGVSIPPPPAAQAQVGGAAERIEIRYLSPASRADPKIQGLSYFYLAPAAPGVLPGMGVVAALPGGPAADSLEIPQSAIVWQSGRPWIYLRAGEGAFSRREIPPGPRSERGGVIVAASALPDPEPEIVTSGAEMLLSEENRAQIQVGEDPNQ